MKMKKQLAAEMETRFEQVRKRNPKKVLCKRDVVEDARDPKTPYHMHIWGKSDEELAYRKREDIAGELIRTVRIINEMVRSKRIKTYNLSSCPKYLHDQQSKHRSKSNSKRNMDQGYVLTTEVARNKAHAKRVIEVEIRNVVAALERALILAEVLKVEKHLNGLMKKSHAVLDLVHEMI